MINLARFSEHDESQAGQREASLPKTLIDRKRGYALFRNRYQDRHDSIATVSCNPDPANGTYMFHDAGSFRIISNGVHWATQQSRRDRDWGKTGLPNISPDLENIVRMPQVDQWQGGEMTHTFAEPDGSGCVHIDLSTHFSRNKKETANSFDISATRSFIADYSGGSGSSELFIIHDHIIGPGEKLWQMHSQAKIATDGLRFTLTHNEQTMHGLALFPDAIDWEITPGEESSRLAFSFDSQSLIILSTNYLADEAISWEADTGFCIGKQRFSYKVFNSSCMHLDMQRD